jgi:hypothetical protein
MSDIFKKGDLDKRLDGESDLSSKAFLSDREKNMKKFGLTPKTRTKKRKKKKK